MSSFNTFRICSNNCRGWNSGDQFASQLRNDHDLCLIQEHWLLPDHLNGLISPRTQNLQM